MKAVAVLMTIIILSTSLHGGILFIILMLYCAARLLGDCLQRVLFEEENDQVGASPTRLLLFFFIKPGFGANLVNSIFLW